MPVYSWYWNINDTDLLGSFTKGGGEEDYDSSRWGAVWRISRQRELLKCAAMLSVKDGLSEEGDLSIRAEFLKGHLPEAAAGAKHQALSWAPEGGEHGTLTASVANKQGQGFLVWQLPEPSLHKMVTTLFLVNPEKKGTSYSLVLRWSELEVPPAMFSQVWSHSV